LSAPSLPETRSREVVLIETKVTLCKESYTLLVQSFFKRHSALIF
jgi:hypothetical protein